MKIPLIGDVTLNKDYNWLESKPVAVAWHPQGKCSFLFKGYANDPNKEDFHKAIQNLLSRDKSVLTQAQEHLVAYCNESLEDFDPDDAPMKPLKKPSDVWKHIRLGETFLVSRKKSDDIEDGIYFSLDSSCDWEDEHGLQIVFRDGLQITKLGPYNGHVTNAYAFDNPKLLGVVYKSRKLGR